MDVNYSRYMDSVGVSGLRKNTFLNNWRSKMWEKFYKKYEHEFQANTLIYCTVYDNCKGYDEFRKVRHLVERTNPTNIHKLEFFFVSIPSEIESWLCCGFKLKWDAQSKHLTWIDNYHMMSKLCRYKTWKNVKITWWDRLRFKWITGFEFEKEST